MLAVVLLDTLSAEDIERKILGGVVNTNVDMKQ